jgi:hypothetical protein
MSRQPPRHPPAQRAQAIAIGRVHRREVARLRRRIASGRRGIRTELLRDIDDLVACGEVRAGERAVLRRLVGLTASVTDGNVAERLAAVRKLFTAAKASRSSSPDCLALLSIVEDSLDQSVADLRRIRRKGLTPRRQSQSTSSSAPSAPQADSWAENAFEDYWGAMHGLRVVRDLGQQFNWSFRERLQFVGRVAAMFSATL